MGRKCKTKTTCDAKGCSRPAVSGKYCNGHRMRVQEGRPVDGPLRVATPGIEAFVPLVTLVRLENRDALKLAGKGRGLTMVAVLDEVLTAWRMREAQAIDEDAAVAELREASRRTEESVAALRAMLGGGHGVPG